MRAQVDGHDVQVATGGIEPTGAAPALVLLHGAGMDGTAWQLQTRWLAHHGVRPYAVDLPGHGRSGGQPLTSIADLADWTVRLLDAVGLERANLAGHSMGTFIALETGARHPDRISSITLVATAEAMPVHPELLSSAADDVARAAALMASWSHGAAAQTAPNPTPGLSMVGGARALVEASRPGALAADFAACAAYEGATEAASQLSCPVTMVIGRSDKMTPARSARSLGASLPDGALTIVEVAGAGHMLMTEAPGEVRQALLAATRVDRADGRVDN